MEVDTSLLQPLQEQLIQHFSLNPYDNIQDSSRNLQSEKLIVGPFCRDVGFLRRCLLARNNDFDKALALATLCIRWREKVQPSTLTVKDFPTANSQQVYAFAGHAKNGWPVLLVKSCRWNPWKFSVAEYVRQLSFMIETMERSSADPLTRAYIVFDMRDMSYRNSDLRKIRELAKVACEYYPERVGYAVGCNVDALTAVLWNFIAPLLDARTRQRVRLFRPGHHHDFFRDHFPAENIPPSLGGSIRRDEWPAITQEIADAYRWNNNDADSKVSSRERASQEVKSKKEKCDPLESTRQGLNRNKVKCESYITVGADTTRLWTGTNEIIPVRIKS